MNVIMVIASLGIGGTEQKLIRVANEFTNNGINVTVLSLSKFNTAQSKLHHSVKFDVLETNNTLKDRIFASRNINQYFINHELAHGKTCIFFFNYYPAMYVKKRKMTQIVFINTTHTINIMAKIKKKIALLRMKYANKVIVGNEQLKENLILINQEIKDKSDVIYNGIDISPNIKNDYSTTKFKTAIVARLRPDKKHDTLFNAIATLKDKGINIELDCIGDEVVEGYKKKLTRQVDDNNITDQVHFLGNVSNVPSILHHYDLFVLPSNDTFSNALLEAMSAGCPVLAANIGGSPEIITNGVDGLLFQYNDSQDLADKIEELYLSQDKRQKIGQHAVETIKTKFTSEIMFKKYENNVY
ncbi:MAG: glycosyltransferase family 4 protein [Aliivibrio sp.]|uniref:glycosyltransferase family 4 protein n=1 Tax=Aliivibrio sp. TaxID=1872443 RepID=UPI001A42FAC8|nr:glycosyltransferase family 4 protein [Aliivibrio sp.]